MPTISKEDEVAQWVVGVLEMDLSHMQRVFAAAYHSHILHSEPESEGVSREDRIKITKHHLGDASVERLRRSHDSLPPHKLDD